MRFATQSRAAIGGRGMVPGERRAHSTRNREVDGPVDGPVGFLCTYTLSIYLIIIISISIISLTIHIVQEALAKVLARTAPCSRRLSSLTVRAIVPVQPGERGVLREGKQREWRRLTFDGLRRGHSRAACPAATTSRGLLGGGPNGDFFDGTDVCFVER